MSGNGVTTSVDRGLTTAGKYFINGDSKYVVLFYVVFGSGVTTSVDRGLTTAGKYFANGDSCMWVYALLHANDFPERNVRFFWQDVACQYWDYAERVTPQVHLHFK